MALDYEDPTMRGLLAIAPAALLALASACGGTRSPLKQSTSGTGGSTTSGTTGSTGTTGSATSAGTAGGTLTPGAACSANAQCLSDVCGINGMGRCCRTACSIGDVICGATACDDAGACVYPVGMACGTPSCRGNMLTVSTCNAGGTCAPEIPSPCPSHLVCNSAGSACAPPQATGPCSADDECISGICGAAGTGHCCTNACSTNDATCRAVDCDESGACVYPNDHTPCGLGAGCTGATQTDATTCDGKGTCPPPHTKDCSPYKCGASTCLADCTDDTSCVAGVFCDNKVCCSVTKLSTIRADWVLGSDAVACCGVGTNTPCATINRAMTLIDNAKVQNVTMAATVDGGGGDWDPGSGERYPLVLGWGVELSAPGVFFFDPTDDPRYHTSIFDIAFYSKNDKVGYASIVGSATRQVGVGMNAANNIQTPDISSIAVEANNTLYLANASVNGSASKIESSQAILVNAGATLVAGQDQSGAVTGTVNVGNALGQHATDGFMGIYCASDYASVGCTVKDAPLVGQSALVVQGQEFIDIDAEDFSNVTLTASPVIGAPPSAAGFGNCASKNDGRPAAVLINGPVNFTFKNGTVQCIPTNGFQMATTISGTGGAKVTIDNTIFQNVELAIYASTGTTTVTNSTFQYNVQGVFSDYDGTNNGTIDLSGGGNTIVCSSNVESFWGSTTPGIDVINRSQQVLKADNVAWDTTGPDYFQCDWHLGSCHCNLASCTTSAGSDDMDAVEVGDAGITTTGNVKFDGGCS
jgi:hypothetical protein